MIGSELGVQFVCVRGAVLGWAVVASLMRTIFVSGNITGVVFTVLLQAYVVTPKPTKSC